MKKIVTLSAFALTLTTPSAFAADKNNVSAEKQFKTFAKECAIEVPKNVAGNKIYKIKKTVDRNLTLTAYQEGGITYTTTINENNALSFTYTDNGTAWRSSANETLRLVPTTDTQNPANYARNKEEKLKDAKARVYSVYGLHEVQECIAKKQAQILPPAPFL